VVLKATSAVPVQVVHPASQPVVITGALLLAPHVILVKIVEPGWVTAQMSAVTAPKDTMVMLERLGNVHVASQK